MKFPLNLENKKLQNEKKNRSILTSYGKLLMLFKNPFGANIRILYFGFKVNGDLRKKLEFTE